MWSATSAKAQHTFSISDMLLLFFGDHYSRANIARVNVRLLHWRITWSQFAPTSLPTPTCLDVAKLISTTWLGIFYGHDSFYNDIHYYIFWLPTMDKGPTLLHGYSSHPQTTGCIYTTPSNGQRVRFAILFRLQQWAKGYTPLHTSSY
ncbi:hypothetical protein SLE2022_210910 [Rubroshorea leprosula]